MNLIEITCPEGALDETQRRAIAHDVMSTLLVEPDAPPQAVERAGHLTHVWFHAAQTWTTRAGSDRDSAPTPFVVTITVPEAWREELSRRAIGAVRTALNRHVTPGGRDSGAVWINVIGVNDGSIGMNGSPSTSTDLVRYLTQDVEPSNAQELSRGEVIDPVCGMRVQLGPHTHTLEHNGQTIGFCASGCRAVYAEDHNLPIDA
jgi:YHS domain-containing protein